VALYKHTLNGTFPGEIWSFGIHTLGNITVTAAEAAWSAAAGEFWADAGPLFANEIAATSTATAELDQATAKQITRVETGSSLIGTATSESLPYQCAPAVSLRTNLATRAGRGRFYAPSLAVEFVAAGKMTATAQSALLAGAVGMIGSLTAAGLDVVLYGRTSHATQSVTRVDVGDVIDTQRRRRNKLVESRVSANV
jgi:hypothetical protein